MSVISSWQGWVTTAGGRVAAWFDAAGTMGLRINGSTFTGSTFESPGNIGYCDFTGMDPDSQYDAEILLDGVAQTQQFSRTTGSTRPVWTQRTDGGFRGLWASCSGSAREMALTLQWTRSYQPDLIVWLGDTVYHESGPLTLFGYTRSHVEGSLALAQTTDEAAWNSNRFFLAKPSFRDLSMLAPIMLQWDDHEIFGDFRNDHAQMASTDAMSGWSPALTSAEELDAIKAARITTGSGTIHAGIPLDADVYYWSIDYGPVRIICPDLVSEAGSQGGTTKISATQLAWYKSLLTTSPPPFIIGAHTKTATDGNSDSWYYWGGLAGAGSQLKDILDYIEANEVATWGVITGDLHHPHVQYDANPQGLGSPTSFSPYLGICAAAENQFNTAVGATTGDIIYKRQEKVIGTFEVPSSQEYVEYQIRSRTGTSWRGRQNVGSNALSYPATTLALNR